MYMYLFLKSIYLYLRQLFSLFFFFLLCAFFRCSSFSRRGFEVADGVGYRTMRFAMGGCGFKDGAIADQWIAPSG